MLVIVLVLAAAAVGALGLVLLRKATEAEPERPQFSPKLLWVLICRRPVSAVLVAGRRTRRPRQYGAGRNRGRGGIRLVASQPGITLANPLVAGVWGVGLFHEQVRTPGRGCSARAWERPC